MKLRVPLLAGLMATAAMAEKAPINFHLDPGVGTGLDSVILLTGATLKVDTTAIKALGPVAPQIEGFGLSAVSHRYLEQGALFGAGIGARLRLFNDEQGFLFNPGTKRTGNLWGNYWVDAHFTWNSGGFGPGFDVGTGAELSLIEGLSVGPFAKFQMASSHSLVMFGLSFTIGAPQVTPAEADYDHDGLKGDDDKCPDDAEDLDGFEDGDGCPEKDNDKDGIEDHADQCPNQAEDKDGVADTDGCPETDADGDGVLDEADKCPAVKGPVENQGCPDTDADGDGVVDRLDACREVKGVADNQGCPDPDTDGDGVVDRLDGCVNDRGPVENKGCVWPDTDKDGVIDPLDNCPKDAGPADNQGCPKKTKQLVIITKDKLVIKDKVYFALGKAQLVARSNTLLDQIASVLKAHPELVLLQVEGHTDNTGDADTNRALSLARATAVVDYLTNAGVEASRLKAVGFGPDQPTDTNETPAGRDNNRRVEFTLAPATP